MGLEGVYTATIGSLPLTDSEENRGRVMEDLIRIGIDFPNYPQLADMGDQFLRDIRDGRSPPGLKFLEWAKRYLERRGYGDRVRLKACVTGPFTLASYVKSGVRSAAPLSNTALADRMEVERFTGILAETCRECGRRASMVFIDEPILSLITGRERIMFGYSEDDVLKAYKRLRESCGVTYVGTHVCGRIPPLLARILLRTDLDILSHEFHDTPENLDLYDRDSLEEGGKTVSVGCVSAKNPRVESVEEISGLMEVSIARFGENVVFTPDCGFEPLVVEASRERGYGIALHKLRNMEKASQIYK